MEVHFPERMHYESVEIREFTRDIIICRSRL
jgi:hypothetical protein